MSTIDDQEAIREARKNAFCSDKEWEEFQKTLVREQAQRAFNLAMAPIYTRLSKEAEKARKEQQEASQEYQRRQELLRRVRA